jgi:hypothetical protein
MIFKPYLTFPVASQLKIIGDVKTVLDGSVKEDNLQIRVLNKLTFGLGAGSFSDCTCVGETVILNQIGYTSYVDAKEALVTVQGKKDLKSPFLMGLTKESKPSSFLQLNYPEGMVLHQLQEQLGNGLLAYAYVGCLLFEKLACSYLKVAPIHGESINDHAKKYWADTEEHPQCYAYLFGVVITEKGKENFSKEELGKAFYVNPLEKNQGGILSHTHAVLVKTSPSFSTLKDNLNFYDTLEPASVVGARHVFTQSVVKEGLLAIFDISTIEILESVL